jgi:hypothetical protein
MSALFRKPEGVSPQGRLQGVPDDEKFSKKWPTLHNYLTSDAWPDGEVRERGTVLLCVDGPVFKACLIEKTMGLTLWATSTTFLGALEALEGRLGEDKPDWRPNKGKKGK